MLKQHTILKSSLQNLKIYLSKWCRKTSQLTQQLWNFEFSVKYITLDYGFFLRLLNTFTIDTDEHYPTRCYKVNDSKTFKNLVARLSLYALCSQIMYMLQTGSFNQDFYKSYWYKAVYCRIWLERYQVICVRPFSFAKGQQAFEIKLVNI